RRDPRRGSDGRARAARRPRGRCGARGRHLRALPRALRVLQGAGLHRVPPRNAGDRNAEDPQGRSRRSRRASGAASQLLRSPAAEAAEQGTARAMSRRAAYEDVVVATPVTIPYVRFSIRGAHWFLGRALAELVKRSGVAKDRIDGLCVSSFTLAP